MTEPNEIPRSPELMSRHDTALLVVDVQEKLVPFIPGHRQMIWNIRRLIDGAKILGMHVSATEQYPQGLGGTVPELAKLLGKIPDKVRFSSAACSEIFEALQDDNIHRLLLCGIECHVCVAQTAFDLMTAGFRVYVAVDAVGSRGELDYQTALKRMDSSGVTLTTTEAALFEWCQRAGSPEFKQISQLVRETPPPEE